MWRWVLSNRMCVLESSMMMSAGYQAGQGNWGQAAAITVVSILIIPALQHWKREELE